MFGFFRQGRNLCPVVDRFFIVGEAMASYSLFLFGSVSYFLLCVSTHGEKYLNKDITINIFYSFTKIYHLTLISSIEKNN